MLLKNAVVYFRGALQKLDLELEGERILRVAPRIPGRGDDLTGLVISPGLVDIHTHGCAGFDFMTAGPEEMALMQRFYADHGVTALLAAGMTLPLEDLSAAFARIAAQMKRPCAGAAIVGINMEGPYLSSAKKGAHDSRHLLPPTEEGFRQIQQACGGAVRMVDLCPCLPGALDFIRAVKDSTVVSLAHTPACYSTAMAAMEAGASHVTHLFNAMAPFLHREPGLVGAAFDSTVTAELICDGIHLHPSAIRAAFSSLGDRAVLVSDSICAAGMPDGHYTLGGLEVTVEQGRAVLTHGDSLAGSVITLDAAVRSAIRFGISPQLALHAATAAPAAAIRMEDRLGAILPGRRADLAVFTPDWTIHSVYLAGHRL